MAQLELKGLEVYAFVDPATGKRKSTSKKRRLARQAIAVLARDWLSRWFLLSCWAGRVPATQLRDRILNTYDVFRPRRFGIEANGMQVLFGDLVRAEATTRFGRIPLAPVYQPTNVEKTFRIRTGLEPIIYQGRLFIQEKQHEAESEIRGFPTAATMDIVDAIESAIRMAPKRPKGKRHEVEVEKYAKYLRATGCPPHLIKQKVADYERKLAA